MKKKFTFEQWTDYARGLAAPAEAQAVSALLAAGDESGLRLHRLAAGMVEAAAEMKGIEVPSEAVERAVSVFVAADAGPLFQLPAIPLRVLFDSFLQPLPAGLRTQGAMHRETIHQAGEFQLCLRLEQEPGTEVMAVIGQLLPNEDIRHGVSHRPVFVFQKDKLVARTLSSDTGEFQLEFSGRQPLRLVLALADPGRRIELDLEPVAGHKRTKRSRNTSG